MAIVYLVPEDVNSWLENSKLAISVNELEDELEQFAYPQVIGTLAARFVTSTWVDRASTPGLVIQLIAMLYAAAAYRRALSEDLDDAVGLNWAQWLERSVAGYLTRLVEGKIILSEAVLDDADLRLPAFYPNDFSSEDDPHKFEMMMEF